MQTTTWKPPAPPQPRPSWARVIGWYFAGAGATVATWMCVAGVTVEISPTLGRALGLLSFIGGVIVLAKQGGRLPHRCVVALVLGVITPFVLAVAFIIALAWAFAHSSWTF